MGVLARTSGWFTGSSQGLFLFSGSIPGTLVRFEENLEHWTIGHEVDIHPGCYISKVLSFLKTFFFSIITIGLLIRALDLDFCKADLCC